MFDHVDLNLEPLKRQTIDGVRYYSIPDKDELVKYLNNYNCIYLHVHIYYPIRL